MATKTPANTLKTASVLAFERKLDPRTRCLRPAAGTTAVTTPNGPR